MDYENLGGAKASLEALRDRLKDLKGACNDSILLIQDAGKWVAVQEYIQTLIDGVDEACNNWPTNYGTPMKDYATNVVR